jgi:hypothetical protein
MLFITNKYSRWYFSITNNAKTRPASKKKVKELFGDVEKHHIIPDSFFINRKRKGPTGWLEGNPEESDNKVWLTPREHFICHWLLVKFTIGIGKAKMICALRQMQNKRSVLTQYNTKITSRVYENLRKEHSQIISAINKGKLAHNKGKPSPNKGKARLDLLGKTQSIESNAKRSAAMSGRLAHNKGKPSKNKGRVYPKVICLHCNKEGSGNAMKQYHYDNCKLRTDK